MYRDFEDLRDNCPAEIQADIALDFHHDDPAELAAFWPLTSDGEFRLYLTSRVGDYWERAARTRGGAKIPEDGLAMEILVDSYADTEMGHTLYLELHAYCGTEEIGEIVWDTFDDETLEQEFMKNLPLQVADLVARMEPMKGLRCEVEISEVAEL